MSVLLREAIGDSIRRARTERRRTLRDVSHAARVSLGYLSEIERGRKEPSSELLASICEALAMSLPDLLDDPDARKLSRVGVVDVGSNSIRMVVFDGAARSPAYFYNEKVMAGLGAGLASTGRLNPAGAARAQASERSHAATAPAKSAE